MELKSIGIIETYGDRIRAAAFIPGDRFAGLATVAASGRVKLVTFGGTKLRYRSATLRQVGVYTEFRKEDWLSVPERDC